MSDIDRLDQRLAAVERAVVDGDTAFDELADLAALADRVDTVERRLEAHDHRIAELEARIDAMGGFVAHIESVNEGVEQQADAAIAAVDRLEYRLDELEGAVTTEGTESAAEADRDVDTEDRSGSTDKPEAPVRSPATEGPIGTEDDRATEAADPIESTPSAGCIEERDEPEAIVDAVFEEPAGGLSATDTGVGQADGSSSSGTDRGANRRMTDSAGTHKTDTTTDSDAPGLLEGLRTRLP